MGIAAAGGRGERLCTVLCSSGCYAVCAPRLQECASARRIPACEASDLLNDRAAHEIGGGGGNRIRSLTAYEAAAFPPGSPAI